MSKFLAQREKVTSLVPQITYEDIKKYICPKADEREINIFLRLCKARGLNPFDEDCYLVKHEGESAYIVISQTYYLKIANRHPMYDNYEQGLLLLSNNAYIEREGTYFDKATETLLGGWAKVYRKDRSRPVTKKVALTTWRRTKRDGSPMMLWRTHQEEMIAKCALKLALKHSFPEDAGMYIEEEYQVRTEDTPTSGEEQDALPDPEKLYEQDMLKRLRSVFAIMKKVHKETDEYKIKDQISKELEIEIDSLRDFVRNDELYMRWMDRMEKKQQHRKGEQASKELFGD